MHDRKQNDIDAVLREVAGLRPSASGWVRATCPFCGKRRKLNYNPSVGFANCFRCGVRVWTRDESPQDYKPQVIIEDGGFEDPSDYQSLQDPDVRASHYGRDALSMLESRGVSERAIREARIGIAVEGADAGRVIVPCISPGVGTWWGWVGRSWVDGSALKYKTASGMHRDRLWNDPEHEFSRSSETLVVVEGVFDALPHWPHACACLGKPTSFQIEKLVGRGRPIALCLDGDAWEESTLLASSLRMRGADAFAVHLPPGKDPGDLETTELRAMIDAARVRTALEDRV